MLRISPFQEIPWVKNPLKSFHGDFEVAQHHFGDPPVAYKGVPIPMGIACCHWHLRHGHVVLDVLLVPLAAGGCGGRSATQMTCGSKPWMFDPLMGFLG